MKVTEKQLAERYAGMTDAELEALDPRRLTPEAALLRAEELKRRGIAHTAAQEEVWARQDAAREKELKKNHARQLTAVALVAVALLTAFAAPRFIDIPGAASTSVVVVLCVLAIYVLRRRS